MRIPSLALVVLLWPAAAIAVDLTKIERSIAKEPAYDSKSPRYCLMVFGPDAGVKKWLVFDGATLYYDRNGNGDLTEQDERIASVHTVENVEDIGTLFVFPLEPISAEQFKAALANEEEEYALMETRPWAVWFVRNAAAAESAKKGRLISDEDTDRARITMPSGDRGSQFAQPRVAAEARSAPIVHFEGPLTLHVPSLDKAVLHPGEETELNVELVATGLGEGTEIEILYDKVPEDAHPVVELEFAVAGGERQKLKFTFDERC